MKFSDKKKMLPGNSNKKYMAAKSNSGIGSTSRSQARASAALVASRLLFKENWRILMLRLRVHLCGIRFVQ